MIVSLAKLAKETDITPSLAEVDAFVVKVGVSPIWVCGIVNGLLFFNAANKVPDADVFQPFGATSSLDTDFPSMTN